MSCPLELLDTLSGARLELRSEGFVTVSEGGGPEQLVETFADYAVTPAGALGVPGDRLLRVNCKTLRGRSTVPAERSTDSRPAGPDATTHCALDRYRARFGLGALRTDPLPVDSLDEPPRLLGGPPPMYPPSMRDAGFSGWVVLGVVIGGDGRPIAAKVMASSNEMFEESARMAVERSVYSRPMRDAQSVNAFKCRTISFAIGR